MQLGGSSMVSERREGMDVIAKSASVFILRGAHIVSFALLPSVLSCHLPSRRWLSSWRERVELPSDNQSELPPMVDTVPVSPDRIPPHARIMCRPENQTPSRDIQRVRSSQEVACSRPLPTCLRTRSYFSLLNCRPELHLAARRSVRAFNPCDPPEA